MSCIIMENNHFQYTGKSWEKEEDERLIQEYNLEKLSFLDICKYHKRMPGGILSRLKRLNLIEDSRDARGYQEYLRSDLCKEVMKIKKEYKIQKSDQKKKPTEKKPIFLKEREDSDLTERQLLRQARKNMPADLEQIKKDIVQLNKKMDKILELLQAVYKFETQEA